MNLPEIRELLEERECAGQVWVTFMISDAWELVRAAERAPKEEEHVYGGYLGE